MSDEVMDMRETDRQRHLGLGRGTDIASFRDAEAR